MNIVVVPDSELGRDVVGRLHGWQGAGLIDSALLHWVGSEFDDALVLRHLDGAAAGPLSEVIPDVQGMLRILALQCEPNVGDQVLATAAQMTQLARRRAANVEAVRLFNLVAPRTGEEVAPATVTSPDAAANVLLLPWDLARPGEGFSEDLSRPAAFASHVALAAVNALGLWHGAMASALDGLGQQPINPLVNAMRSFCRVLLGPPIADEILRRAALEGVFEDGHEPEAWPVPFGMQLASDPARRTEAAADALFEKHAEDLRLREAAKPTIKVQHRTILEAFKDLVEDLIGWARQRPIEIVTELVDKAKRRVTRMATVVTYGSDSEIVVVFGDREKALAEVGQEDAPDWAELARALGVSEPREAWVDATVWEELVGLVLGLADGGDLPVQVRGAGLVPKLCLLAPDPAEAGQLPALSEEVASQDKAQEDKAASGESPVVGSPADPAGELPPPPPPAEPAAIAEPPVAAAALAEAAEAPVDPGKAEALPLTRLVLKRLSAEQQAVRARIEAVLAQCKLLAEEQKKEEAKKGEGSPSKDKKRRGPRRLRALRWLFLLWPIALIVVPFLLALVLPVALPFVFLIWLPLWLGGWALAGLRYHRALFQERYRRTRIDPFVVAQGQADHFIGEAVRLDALRSSLGKAEAVIARCLYRPVAPEFPAAGFGELADPNTGPRALVIGRVVPAGMALGAVAARARRAIYYPGWLGVAGQQARVAFERWYREAMGLDTEQPVPAWDAAECVQYLDGGAAASALWQSWKKAVLERCGEQCSDVLYEVGPPHEGSVAGFLGDILPGTGGALDSRYLVLHYRKSPPQWQTSVYYTPVGGLKLPEGIGQIAAPTDPAAFGVGFRVFAARVDVADRVEASNYTYVGEAPPGLSAGGDQAQLEREPDESQDIGTV